MGLLEQFELAHRDDFLRVARYPLPRVTWKTPDGSEWTPQTVLKGWTSRLSDSWAWLRLHAWVTSKVVQVGHVDLPSGLRMHDASDPAWAFVERLGDDPAVRSPLATFGSTDLGIPYDDGAPAMLVELGACAPVKFVLNLGTMPGTAMMIVPYGCPFAFTFVAGRLLLPTSSQG